MKFIDNPIHIPVNKKRAFVSIVVLAVIVLFGLISFFYSLKLFTSNYEIYKFLGMYLVFLIATRLPLEKKNTNLILWFLSFSLYSVLFSFLNNYAVHIVVFFAIVCAIAEMYVFKVKSMGLLLFELLLLIFSMISLYSDCSTINLMPMFLFKCVFSFFCIFSFLRIVMVIKMLQKPSDYMTIDEDGIKFYESIFMFPISRSILWSDIENIETLSVAFNQLPIIKLKNPTARIYDQTSWFKRISMKIARWESGSHIGIDYSLMQMEKNKWLELLQVNFQQYKMANDEPEPC